MTMRFGSPLDALVTTCYYVQREFGLNYDQVLDMPATTFNVLVHEMEDRIKAEQKAYQRKSKTFSQ